MIANKTHTELMGIVINMKNTVALNNFANNKTGQAKMDNNKNQNNQYPEMLYNAGVAISNEPNITFNEKAVEKTATAGRGFVSNFGDAHILSFLIGGLS